MKAFLCLPQGSAMGGSGDIVLAAASENESGVCLSFKHRKNLTACCNHADNMREYLALIIPVLTSLVFLCLLAICCFIIFLVIISFTFFVLFVFLLRFRRLLFLLFFNYSFGLEVPRRNDSE